MTRGVISQESPEPGYIVVSSPCLSPTRFRHHRHSSPSCFPLSLAIPMASAVTCRRHLLCYQIVYVLRNITTMICSVIRSTFSSHFDVVDVFNITICRGHG